MVHDIEYGTFDGTSRPWGTSGNRYGITAWLALLLLACSCATLRPQAPASPTPAPTAAPAASSLKQLDAVSVQAYHDAADANLDHLRCRAPVVVNDFLNMTLYRCNGQEAAFHMDTKRYFLMARTAHVPLAIYSFIAAQGFGTITSDTEQRLRAYGALLAAAVDEVRGLSVDEATRKQLLELLDVSAVYVGDVLRSGQADEAGFRAYADRVRPLVRANLRVGADEQLRQFRAQLDAWRREFPDEHWGDLRVVVMGFHQARDLYATKQLFQWLLRERGLEDRVVYAEFQFSPFGDKSVEAKRLALDLLSKVDLDHRAAAAILADRVALQRDVMGPAAKQILESWGNPEWP